nr:hypothetical protein [Tanacetum cinerariifolium]
MLGSEYGEQDRKAAVLYEYETFKATEGELNKGDVNDAMGSKKKIVVVTSDPLALIVGKTNVSRSKEKDVVSSDSERKSFYSKPTNNNLRTSSSSQSANKKQEFVKTDNKRVEKKDDEKKRDMSRVKFYNCKKEGHFSKDCKKAKVKDYEYYKKKMLLAKKDKDEQVLLAEDQAWMESSKASSSSADEKISEVSYYLSESESESEYETSKYYDNSTNYGLFVNNDDDQEIFYDAIESASEKFIENHINSQKYYDKSDVNHNDSEEKDQLVDKKNMQNFKAERYEYMNIYSSYFDNNEQHRKQIANQQVLYDKMSVQLVEFDKHVRDLKNTVLEKDIKISELEECVRNKNLEIEKCLERIGFEKPSYFKKAKDLRPTLYDEKVIGLGYTSMFLIHYDEALEIEKQTSSLKPYVPNVILEKIIIDLEDEVVNLLEKEKVNLETIESLKSKECDKVENSKVIAPGMLKLNVSQCVLQISMSKSSCDSNNVKIKLKRMRRLECSTSNCGSKPTGNENNDRILQTPSRNMKKKVEAQPRKVNKKNHVVEPIRNVDVKQSQLNGDSELICATCKKSMFDGVHDINMNTTQAEQKALDNTLVAPVDCLEFGKCNMRLKIDIKAKEAIFQLVLDALTLTPLYRAFLITVDRNFREILQICPKIPGQEFKDLPLEHDILSFIRDLRHTRDITYLTDVNVDYLHQPWRGFATVTSKCLSGKETRMDKICLSRAQILWGMFYKKNIDYVYLLWEDLLFQIKNKDHKKTNKMSYPRFTKIIIDYFMSKDQSILRRNKMFWHSARDDTMYTSMICISRHEKTQSKVPDEQQQMTSGTNKGTGTILRVPDVPIYDFESDKESWGNSNEEDDDMVDFIDDDDNDDDSSEDHDDESDDEKTNENIDEEEDDEVTKELYKDVNGNLGNKDADMTYADQADNEIASLMDTTAYHATSIPKITSNFTTPTPPPPLFFNPLEQEATPTLTPMALETTTSLLDFASVFKFNERVTNLEKDLLEIKQVDQYAQALSFIHAIADRYMDNKLRKAINKAIQAHNFDCREEVQAEKREYIELVDSTSLYEATATLFEFELTKILIDKMEKNKSFDVANYKRELYDALIKSYNTNKDIFESYAPNLDISILISLSIHRSQLEDLGMQQDQEFVMGDNDEQPGDKEVTKADWFKKPNRPPTPNPDLKLEYHLEECSKATIERFDCHNPQNKPYPFDLRKPLPLIQDHRGRQIILKDYFVNKDLEYLKGGDLSRKYSTLVTKTKAATYELK